MAFTSNLGVPSGREGRVMGSAARKRQRSGRNAVQTTEKLEISNLAPNPRDSAPLLGTSSASKALRQAKHNPLPGLKPEMLSRALDAFERGHFREPVLLFEKMAERDDMLASVKAKREKDVSQLDMQVTVTPDSGPEGLAHQEVLEKFWRSCRAVNAYDRNERGGFRRLVKQMMSATSFKYAAHHIIWTPQADGSLQATFEFIPLWLFENTTGKLRYLQSITSLAGEVLDESEWMVTVGDGLMVACSIGYLAKRAAFNDWLIFSEKFSVPGVLGRTSAVAGSPAALAMETAVQAFGHDFVACITGDDGTHAKPIEIIQASGNPAGMPMPAVIERVDRRMAALYRGADLSSMSSGQYSRGQGASLQDKETAILLRDDAETLAETLAEVSRLVLEWTFGNGVEPLARVELVVPLQEDATSLVSAATLLVDRGAKVSAAALMERLNLPKAVDDEDALRSAERGTPNVPVEEMRNSEGGTRNGRNEEEERLRMSFRIPHSALRISSEMQALRDALRADMEPLGDALYSAVETQDFAAMTAALRKISKGMPELMGDAVRLSRELAVQMAAAWAGKETRNAERGKLPVPLSEELANAGNSDGASKGWETRRANGWTSKRAAAEIVRGTESMQRALASKKDVLSALDVPGLGPVDFRWGNSDGGIKHIVEKHGEADAMQVPAMLFKGELMKGKTRAWVSTDETYVMLTNNLYGEPTNHWVISGYVREKKKGGVA